MENCITKKELELKNALRALWEQHVAWTRMTIVAIATGSSALPQVSQRLLRNADDMAAAFKPFYGEEKADKFGELIRQHLLIAADLVTAAKKGDTAAAAKAEKEWYANAKAIAKFLSGINPYWQEKDLDAMLTEHLDLTKAEALTKVRGNTARSIELYDRIEKQALAMADALSEGIIRQFPEDFK